MNEEKKSSDDLKKDLQRSTAEYAKVDDQKGWKSEDKQESKEKPDKPPKKEEESKYDVEKSNSTYTGKGTQP